MEVFERDLISVLSRPVVVGEFRVDLERAEAFVAARRAAGAPVGYTTLYVKAAALSALEAPALRRMDGHWRVHELATIDVGVSVLSRRSMVGPVVVVERADTKSLDEIEAERKLKTRQARADADRYKALIDRYLRFVPAKSLRRAIIRAFLAAPRRRRGAVGTIQISNLDGFGIDRAHVPLVGELLLVAGEIGREVTAEGERIVIRRSAWFTIHGSHRKLNGQTCGAFIRRFRALLADPERLL
jgi:pyruvate/2-oxoglutarate dehydrogenase complex dihydrolipoamide acyltransferase (E2) component